VNVSDITPYLGVFAPIAGGLAVLDYILTAETKKRVCELISGLAKIGRRPLTKGFYVVSLVVSVVSTIIILVASGVFSTLVERGWEPLSVLKSSGPLVLAIILKILAWDYILALKSALFVQSFQRYVLETPEAKRPKGGHYAAMFGLLIFWDIIFSAILTGGFLYYAEHFQSLHGDAVTASPIFPRSVAAFFDEFSFVAKNAIEKSFYALNGSLLFFGTYGLAYVIDRFGGRIDSSQLQKNVFKIIAAFTSLIVLITVMSYNLAVM